MRLRHICEVCGKEEVLTPDEAYQRGWDYPPKMGAFGVISPRTCKSCNITATAWWAMTCDKKTFPELPKKQRETVLRILAEPASILVTDGSDAPEVTAG